MRIEENKRVRLVEIDILGQPVKRAGVIVLDVNGQSARLDSCERGAHQQRRKGNRGCWRVHRAA